MHREKIGSEETAMRMGMMHPAINLTGYFPIHQLSGGDQDFGILLEDQGVTPPVMHLIWDESEWERVQKDGIKFLRSRTRRTDEDSEIAEFLAMQPFIGNPSDERSGPTAETVEQHTADEVLDAFAAAAVETAGRIAKSAVEKNGNSQDAAFWEFLYGLLFIAIQNLGAHMAQEDVLPEDHRDALLTMLHNRVLGRGLASRLTKTVAEDQYVDLFNAHAEAARLRSDFYLGMRLFPEEGEGFANTLVWEIPKQAVRSALGDPVAQVPTVMATSVEFSTAIGNLAIVQGMQYLAAAFRRETT